ncbi:DUF2272 domain-containing protein [Variovorax sp. J22P168]|uniref:DUF2272 domain-containing protein n=1 Tax=Variovorax jilinensis TaxID=3053513 RepID=UPI002577B8C6|nr:DUF2272 domain-containing protein [Variovorax sp. J22P168]MDM0014550.1 DUF2272 domain-containing protein [Variovorax sp. J22P168]
MASFHALRRLLAVGATFLVLSPGAPAFASTDAACLDTGGSRPPSDRALALAAAARREHLAFGGQSLDAEGRLVASGLSEAEDVRASALAQAPWQRVLDYWRAVDPTDDRLPYLVRFGGLRPAERVLLQQSLRQATTGALQGLGVGPDQGLATQDLRAVEAALARVAVIDTPWSAAFVSWLAREARLGPHEFAFSEAHADYAGAAWQAGIDEAAGRGTAYALRACDLTRTPPRVGDLVCQARGSVSGLDSFERIGEALVRRGAAGGALPMHCDVVVAVDEAGFDAVGGNVLQSVTSRRLAFAPGTRLLDRSYLPDGCVAGAANCVDRHLSRQPWSLLLQWR